MSPKLNPGAFMDSTGLFEHQEQAGMLTRKKATLNLVDNNNYALAA